MPSARLLCLDSALAISTRTSNSKKNDEAHSFSSSPSIAAGVHVSRRAMAADSNKGFLPLLGKVRIFHRFFAVCHAGFLGVAAWAAVLAVQMCPGEVSIACLIAAAASAIRLLWMVGSAVSQAAVASTMLAQGLDPPCSSSSTITSAAKQTPSMRKKRRMWYVRWLWWGRFGAFVTLLQLAGAVNLTFSFVKNASTSTNRCYSADGLGGWRRGLFLALALAAWVLTVMQCCMGSDILAWSSLYARHSEAWRAYYHEMFDYGIRETLCCLGRAQYITRDEDEVDSVAAVLGDLVSYRAAGATHIEFLAGLALLQIHGPPQPTADQYPPAPTSLVKEATVLHRYAVAAYTGPLLDLGRNPLLFPCAWLHRQGVLTPWNRNRWPKLEGDNWWRGHAAAFLRHSKLPPEALCKGRVHQAKRECAYFVTVVHQLRCVVVAVRGTETPEDLLTDGLGRESMLMESDMRGLLQSEKISKALKQNLLSTKPHFAHEGIIEAARELALQLDNVSENETESSSTSIDINGLGVLMEDIATSQKESGILASLLGPGGECEGYALRFVGHSLGGSIAALTAVRLYARYPQLHVYGYGVLPCLDASTADVCSSFITSIVYNDEFSSRLSVSSIKRLRVAAVKALASETSSDSGTITRLAWQLFGPEKPRDSLPTGRFSNNLEFTKEVTVASRPNKRKGRQLKFRLKGGIYLCSHACRCMIYMSRYSSARRPNIELYDLTQFRPHGGELCQLIEKGTHQQAALEVFPCVEGLMVAGDNGNIVSMPSISIDDHVADTENVCLDAGRDSDYDGVPEESEILVVSVDSGGLSKAEHVKPEENGECHHHTIGEVCHTHESIHKGKAPMNCDSASEARMNPIVCTNLLEENNHCEMFMPGLIVHVVPVNNASSWQLWQGWGKKVQQNRQHQAFIKDRKSFQDIVISPSMFLDHMPWRCQYALNSVLEHVKATMEVANECTDSLV